MLVVFISSSHTPPPPPSPFMRLKGEKRNKSNTTLPLSLYSLLFYFLFSHSLSLSHLPPYFNVKKKKAFLTSFSVKKTLLAFYYYTKIGFRGKKVVEATVGRWVKNSGSLSLSLSFDKVKKKWRRMGWFPQMLRVFSKVDGSTMVPWQAVCLCRTITHVPCSEAFHVS